MPDLPDLPDLPDRAQLAETQELVEAEDVAPLVLLREVAEGDVAVVLAWRGESRDEESCALRRRRTAANSTTRTFESFC